jgi:hypothetical protein
VPASLGAVTARRASRGSGGSGEFPALAKWSPGSELRQRLPSGPRGARHLPSPERESCSAFCPQVSLAFWISPPPPLPLYLPKQVLLEGASGKAHRGRGLGVLWRRLVMLQSRLGAPWLAGAGDPAPRPRRSVPVRDVELLALMLPGFCVLPGPRAVPGRERGELTGERKPPYGSWPHLLPPPQILWDFKMPRTRAQ